MMDTEQLVIEEIRFRKAVGLNKYKVSVADNPLELKLWLQHAFEECVDMAIYLKRIQQELQRLADDGK